MSYATRITEEHIDNVLAETYLDLLDNLYAMLIEVNSDDLLRASLLRRIRWIEAQVPVMLEEHDSAVEDMPELDLVREVGSDESSYNVQLMIQAQQQAQQ